MINPIATRLIDALPLPNVGGQEYNYFANVPFHNNGSLVDGRLDWRTDKTSMSLRYGLSYFNTSQGSVFPGLSADGGYSRLRDHEGTFSVNHIFNPNTITTLQVGMTRYSDPLYAFASGYSGAAFGFTEATVLSR